MREAIEEGHYREAEAIAQKMLGRPKYQQAYMPFGDLFLDFPKGEEPSDYRRTLNMRTAVSEVSYRMGEEHFTRKVIASRPDEGIVIRLECDKPGRITFALSLTSPHPSTSRAIVRQHAVTHGPHRSAKGGETDRAVGRARE